ncbi:hypothetical protein SNOG_11770 [Parastagonospora nodorum SN15]|uniref:Uncharacterized protein n=1 Tax=Phaeosphaeria nodorum (strain SN15 / ATCC MYA-4574 / FGSC 10173) TaxID=321614 RepID=Q0U8Z4_PHANO|nr:hypothetical protein SNOG_11770 [Parastagonospora nodorum SN15]EAT80814.1 hypothetical protein SNOG_11770 [Parastagonospora nodorum SN15]
MPTNRGRGIKKQLCPFAGIIQIKFEREKDEQRNNYELRFQLYASGIA